MKVYNVVELITQNRIKLNHGQYFQDFVRALRNLTPALVLLKMQFCVNFIFRITNALIIFPCLTRSQESWWIIRQRSWGGWSKRWAWTTRNAVETVETVVGAIRHRHRSRWSGVGGRAENSGRTKRIFSCRSQDSPWTWLTCGGFRTCATRTVEVSFQRRSIISPGVARLNIITICIVVVCQRLINVLVAQSEGVSSVRRRTLSLDRCLGIYCRVTTKKEHHLDIVVYEIIT